MSDICKSCGREVCDFKRAFVFHDKEHFDTYLRRTGYSPEKTAITDNDNEISFDKIIPSISRRLRNQSNKKTIITILKECENDSAAGYERIIKKVLQEIKKTRSGVFDVERVVRSN